MPVVPAERYATGMTWSEFFAGCTKNLDLREKGYSSVVFTPEQEQVLGRLRDRKLKVLVIEEDWCGDAARSGPVLARIAEAAGMEARWFLRDQNLDLMDQYLENGTSRAIPAFVFMDENGEYLTHWGSRPAGVKAAREAFGPLPAKDDPGYAAAFERFRQMIGDGYAKNYPAAIVDELLDQVTRALAARQ
jgi:hypothetical protein